MYTKTTWVNRTAPYLEALNLNHMEKGIFDNSNAIDAIGLGETAKGEWTPTVGTEYPTSPTLGDSYFITGLSSPYTFAGGDLTGHEADNQDKIYYSDTGWILVEQRNIPSDIPKYIDTIADLAGVDINTYTTVIVKEDGRGGIFSYDVLRIADNDGGTVFDGWVRLFSGAPDVKMYGAVGDNVNDDTAAIILAIDGAYAYRAANKALYFPNGSYKVTSTITIPEDYEFFTIFGDSSMNTGITEINFHHPETGSPGDPMQYWIDNRAEMFAMTDIRFRGRFQSGGYADAYAPFTLLRSQRTDGTGTNIEVTADTDTTIENCAFRDFYVGIEHWGRGLESTNNSYILCYNAIVLEWDVYPESPANIGKDTTGFRAFNINTSRFHSLGGAAITNKGTNAHKILGIIVSHSLLDIGRSVFEGVLKEGEINNTVCTMTPVTAINLKDGSENYQVNNLVSTGSTDASRVPSTFIYLQGNHYNGTFNGVTLSNCTEHMILSAEGALNGVTFNNISVGDVGDADADKIFRFDDYAHNVVINNLTYSGTRDLTQPIYVVNTTASLANIFISNYHALNSVSPIDTSDGIIDFNKTKYKGQNDDNLLNFFDSDTTTLLGRITNALAGTRGITIESEGSINLDPTEGSIRPMADNITDLGMSTRAFRELFTNNISAKGLPVYEDEAGAIGGGLAQGDFYITSTGEIRGKL